MLERKGRLPVTAFNPGLKIFRQELLQRQI